MTFVNLVANDDQRQPLKPRIVHQLPQHPPRIAHSLAITRVYHKENRLRVLHVLMMELQHRVGTANVPEGHREILEEDRFTVEPERWNCFDEFRVFELIEKRRLTGAVETI